MLLAQLIYFDSFNITETGKFGENSYTEWAQVIVLIIVISLMAFTSKIDKKHPIIGKLISGFFLMALIREFDSVLDGIFDGLWQILVFLVLVFIVVEIIRKMESVKQSMDTFLRSTSFGFFTSGFLVTFVFSRLYGRSLFWESVMGEGYVRAVKNVSEESIELLGYTLILFGTIEWFKLLTNKKRAI